MLSLTYNQDFDYTNSNIVIPFKYLKCYLKGTNEVAADLEKNITTTATTAHWPTLVGRVVRKIQNVRQGHNFVAGLDQCSQYSRQSFD
jgi:hypothetical protein